MFKWVLNIFAPVAYCTNCLGLYVWDYVSGRRLALGEDFEQMIGIHNAKCHKLSNNDICSELLAQSHLPSTFIKLPSIASVASYRSTLPIL
jgi:hypothetical protein